MLRAAQNHSKCCRDLKVIGTSSQLLLGQTLPGGDIASRDPRVPDQPVAPLYITLYAPSGHVLCPVGKFQDPEARKGTFVPLPRLNPHHQDGSTWTYLSNLGSSFSIATETVHQVHLEGIALLHSSL